MPIVAPEHRPTLREELAPLPPRARWAVIAVLVLIAVALLAAVHIGHAVLMLTAARALVALHARRRAAGLL